MGELNQETEFISKGLDESMMGCRNLVFGLIFCGAVIGITVVGFAKHVPVMAYCGLIAFVTIPIILWWKNNKKYRKQNDELKNQNHNA